MNDFDTTWKLPLPFPVLTPGKVHIWRVALEQPASLVERLAQTLSPDERARAGRFHFARDRRRFIVARASLRALLAGYTGVPAEQLEFSYSDKGKPALARPGPSRLHFNLAHSDELALYAFTLDGEVGIDVEKLRTLDDARQIAMHYFSEREYDSLHALSDEKLYHTFFTYWTRKEAYIKGSGEGLELLNKRLDVISTPDQGLPLPDVNGGIHWFLYDLEAAPTYLAALAVQQRDVDIVHCW